MKLLGVWRVLRYETRQVALFLLIAVHSLVTTFGVVVALFDIESIILSGPVLSFVCLLIGYLAHRRKRPACLYYALATPTVSLICFAVIFLKHWSPGQAQVPIGAFLVFFSLVNAAIGAFAIRELLQPAGTTPRRGPFQFGISTIMGLTLVVAVALSLYKTLGEKGAVLATLWCHVSLISYVLKRYHQSTLPCGDTTTAPPAPDRRTSDGGE